MAASRIDEQIADADVGAEGSRPCGSVGAILPLAAFTELLTRLHARLRKLGFPDCVVVRGYACLGALGSLVVLAAGCGGAKAPSVAHIGTTSATAPESYEQARMKWAECVRAHGVPNFPEANSQGAVNLAGLNVNSPQFLAALQACQSLVVAAPPDQAAQIVKRAEAVAQCMRKHGVPNFPDPNSHGTIVLPGNVDPNSAQFQAATQACRTYMAAAQR